ncbi:MULTISPECIES: hypothetical protein [Mesonia]|uniref:hypothetical protein n=1 Tax=Mesonia TaxID=232115 RepID=UPI0026EB902A|nr:hypothetical protein [Mesonia mobilis]
MTEFNFKIIVLITNVLRTGLTIGLYATWSNVVMPSLKKLGNLEILTKNKLKETSAAFETPWNRWNFLHTITSFISFLTLLTGNFFAK